MTVKKTKSRQGKHPDYYVMFGGMVPPRKKAIAMITAAVAAGSGKMSVLDLIWKGIENIAMSYGVLDKNGEVTEQYKDAVCLAEYSIGENQRKARQKNG